MKKWVKRVRDTLEENLGTVEERDSSTTTAAVVEENLGNLPSFVSKSGNDLIASPIIQKVERELEKSLQIQRLLHKNIELKIPEIKQRDRQFKVSQKIQYDSMVIETAKLFSQLVVGEKVPYSLIKNKVQNFYNTLIKDKYFLLNLSTVRTDVHNEKSLYYHAVNTALMSMAIPTTLGFSRQEIIEIGVAGLLADVGMELVPKNIQFKSDKLTKDDIYQVEKHTIYTCNILENVVDLPFNIKIAAYQHHERESGVGYPRKRKSDVIHEYAQIISAVDVYEALTSPRPHRKPINPYNAMKNILEQTKSGMLNKNKVKSFLNHFGLFPIGSLVKISNGCIAKVVGSNGLDVTKPILAILTNSNQELLKPTAIQFLDLQKTDSVKIVSIVDKEKFEDSLLLGF